MVKYADGPSASTEVLIAAAAEVVWPLVSDINLPAQFSNEFRGAEWLSDERGVGATFEGTNFHPARGEWTTTSTVTTFDEGRAFGWTIGDLDHRTAWWQFDLEAEGARTMLRFSAQMGPAPSGLQAAIDAMPDREEDIIARRLDTWNENMTLTVEGIKELAERQ